jgi:hypothetical protein
MSCFREYSMIELPLLLGSQSRLRFAIQFEQFVVGIEDKLPRFRGPQKIQKTLCAVSF